MYLKEQLQELEKHFWANRYPSYQERVALAARLNLDEHQVQVGPRPPPSPLATGSTRKVALLRLDHLPSVPGYRGEGKPEGPRAPLAHRASKGPPVGTQGRTPGSPPPCAARTSRHEPAQTDGPLGVGAPELRASAKAGDPLGQAPSWPPGSRVSKPRPHCPLHPRGTLNWAPGGP